MPSLISIKCITQFRRKAQNYKSKFLIYGIEQNYFVIETFSNGCNAKWLSHLEAFNQSLGWEFVILSLALPIFNEDNEKW